MNEQDKPMPPSNAQASPFANLPERKPFTASAREIWAALTMYVLAYVYVDQDLMILPIDKLGEVGWLIAFTAAIVVMTEALHREKKRSRECWVWLGCMVLIEAGVTLHRSTVWTPGQSSLFVHLCFVWWVLCRSGVLLEGETGRMLPVDAVFGYLIYPFEHFFLRIRCLWYAIRQTRGARQKARPKTVAWSLLAVAVAVMFFITAINLLAGADTHFRISMAKFLKAFTFHVDGFDDFLGTLLLSLPVAAWLFGLIAGTGRVRRDDLDARAKSVDGFVRSLRQVPTAVWVALTAAFCVLYAVFFVLHAPYLLGAFRRNLPAGYTLSRYARQGFFELCKLMAVNFALLWLSTRMSRNALREHKWLKTSAIVLLAESLLFAVIAASKLWLYIDCFGFTPLRLQSAWLICSLAFGCLCAVWSIVKRRKTFRAWVIFSAVTLSILHLF